MQPLNTCPCCDGVSVQTPVLIDNRPGLQAIAYRVGAYTQFKQSLLSRLSGSGPWLRKLTTRDTDDFTIALLDAWSVVADVLTFYQERIANESYLNTATERLSVVELARLIGYPLQPGVAASTYLAFTLDEAPGAFAPQLVPGTTRVVDTGLPPIRLEPGIRVQSVPGPNEVAQTFETIQAIEARADWNAIRPRLTQPQPISLDSSLFILKGTTNAVKPGDSLLIRVKGKAIVRNVLKVSLNDDSRTTCVELTPTPVLPAYVHPQSLPVGQVSDFSDQIDLDGDIIRTIVSKSWKEEDLSALVQTQNWSVDALKLGIANQITSLSINPPDSAVFVFRKRSFAFGYNAQERVNYTRNGPQPLGEWHLANDEKDDRIFLDNGYEEILPDQYIAIQFPDQPMDEVRTFAVEQASVRSRTAYGLSARTTALTLAQKWRSVTEKDTLATLRELTIHAQNEPLSLADLPIDQPPIGGNTITLDRYYPGLKTGQSVMLVGKRTDLPTGISSEVMILKEIRVEQGFTVIISEQSLTYTYLRNSVSINANVALATHGETVQESLGSGDATKVFQQFVLRQPPLTYISGTGPNGAQTTLSIRVNDLLWHEVPSFLGHGPDERIYTTRQDDTGNTTVMFGDGKTGSRLPTGPENVRAYYRKGIGLGGLVKANQLSQLLSRPLGVKGVNNPLAANGAADRESLSEARRNAPLPIRTLGRIVSLQDYEDFAHAFAGIDKALATWTWSGQRRSLLITIAGINGAAVEADSLLYKNLLTAIRNASAGQTVVALASYQPRYFRLKANLQVHPDNLPPKVLVAVESRLRDRFSFQARSFGQAVTYSEVVAVMQNVPGVVAVDLDEFYRAESVPTSSQVPILNQQLDAAMPRPDGDAPFPAELLMLDPRPITLSLMS